MRLGRGAPEVIDSESFVQLSGADTIYHLHANAAHAFDAGDPPMLDGHVWPRALKPQPFERVEFDSSHEVHALYKQLDDSYLSEMKKGLHNYLTISGALTSKMTALIVCRVVHMHTLLS